MSNAEQGSAKPDIPTVARSSKLGGEQGRGRRVRVDGGHGGPIPDEELTPTVRSVVSTLMDEVERLKRDLELSHQKLEELENIADEDPLVPILNRRAFEREMVRATAYARRYKTPTSLIFFDLDEFKAINDTYGHAGGDAVLRHVGYLLSTNVRQSDVVARIGGDEFAVILTHADSEAAGNKMGRLLEMITAEPVKFGDTDILIGASGGVAQFGENDDMAALLDRADRAMYEHKERHAGG